MKKYIEKEIIETKKVATHVTCNKCGHTSEIDVNRFELNKFQEVDFSFGYGSKYDMEDWEFHLCEDCVEELVKSFKYVPKGMESYEWYDARGIRRVEEQLI
mgnify:CR=1 FL=1